MSTATRLGLLLILVVFIVISWAMRALLSQRVSDRVFREEDNREE